MEILLLRRNTLRTLYKTGEILLTRKKDPSGLARRFKYLYGCHIQKEMFCSYLTLLLPYDLNGFCKSNHERIRVFLGLVCPKPNPKVGST